MRFTGSPPRAWGQSYRLLLLPRELRFTPTGVGTIGAVGGALTARPVHPHGRGDNRRRECGEVCRDGSPPRAWGQCSVAGDDARCDRFTPTGVGTMACRRASRRCVSVHPHGRGDNLRLRAISRPTDGSPPRAWGQSHRLAYRGGRHRFTPTGVGTIAASSRRASAIAVHPHGRGDNTPQTAPSAVPARFTPTGVGTIATASASATLTTVHPHGRGDNFLFQRGSERHLGSPPRAWGQWVPLASWLVQQRFTPTGVGTMVGVVLGESGKPCGSPPRAWGQWPGRGGHEMRMRFTPTGVGTMRLMNARTASSTVHPHGRGDNGG